jgi:hypothetical protein
MSAFDSSDSSIKQQINYFIQVEEGLLAQCRRLRSMTADAAGQLIAAGLSEGAKAIATDLFSSALAGRYAKRFAKNYLRQDTRRALAVQESNIDAQHQYTVRSALGLLQSVSENKLRSNQPKSQSLIARINRAQVFSRLETRINRTILALKDIAGKRLVYNHELASRATEKLLPRPKPTVKFPRIANILTEVAGFEPKLRRHIRNVLKKEYGVDWQVKIREKFGSSYPKWGSVSRQRGGADILDGTQFGDLINILNQFDVLRTGTLATRQAQLALTIIQGERRLLVHPLEDFTEDIDESRYKTTSMAILSLTSIL